MIICVSGHRHLPVVFVFWQVSVVIITIFRALRLVFTSDGVGVRVVVGVIRELMT